MTDQRPITTLPQSSYSIKEAADLIGKSNITIVRWCRDGVFSNAGKVPGPKGDEWSIPADDLAGVIEAKNLKIDLRDQSGSETDRSPELSQEDMIGLLQENAELRQQTGHLTGQNDQLAERLKKLGDDLDHAQSEWRRTATDRDQAIGEAGVLREQLERSQNDAKAAEAQRAQLAQERDSLDLQHRELQKSSAESLSALSDDLDGVRSDLENATNQQATTAGERDELAAKLAKAESSMGWWTRRRYRS